MTDLAAALAEARLPYREYGITAIDSYCGHSMRQPVKFYLVEGSVIDLAKRFDALDYPALPYADASLGAGAASFEARFLCAESVERTGLGALALTDFRRNPANGHYGDPRGVYPLLKDRIFPTGRAEGPNLLFESAAYLSRFGAPTGVEPSAPAEDWQDAAAGALPHSSDVSPLWQKDILTIILQGPRSSDAFELLRASGFVAAYWPELDALLKVDHAKDCHPEGGGWSHTMEALGHRKTLDLTLSLAILLHDIGKPHAESSEGHRFDKHAEIGARLASRFLRSLGFAERIVDDVYFMIRWHMMPAALPRLPAAKVSDVVLDPRFPDLLELFRCDEFSTFKGPDTYYAGCAAYKAFMRNHRNPYRDQDGRKKAQTFSRP
ncbi:HD domain-containing protein [bacterium]|nr:HD domain-containing protein [bacterium]